MDVFTNWHAGDRRPPHAPDDARRDIRRGCLVRCRRRGGEATNNHRGPPPDGERLCRGRRLPRPRLGRTGRRARFWQVRRVGDGLLPLRESPHFVVRHSRADRPDAADGLDAIGSIEELESMSWCTKLVALPEAVRGLNALEELYFVDPANDNAGAAEEADEVGTPTALSCFGSSSGDTPSSPCPEPSSRNLRGRR